MIKKYILNRLLDKYEESSLFKQTNQKNINIYLHISKATLPKYFDKNNYDFKYSANIDFKDLSELNYIKLFYKNYRNDVISKVQLNLSLLDDIYKYLSRNSKYIYETTAIDAFNKYVNNNNWLSIFAQDMIAKLKNHKSIKKYFDISNLIFIKNILFAIDSILKQQDEIFIRVLSVNLFNDSKFLEKNENLIKRIMFEYGDYIKKDTVLQEENVIKSSGHIFIKGNVVFSVNNQIIDLSKFNDDIGLGKNTISNIKILKLNVSKVITIENKTSFNIYNTENELVIYLGGYHNGIRREFLKKLYLFDSSIPFYHWGDIDIGGFRIFNHLSLKTGISFNSFKMDVDTLIKHKDYSKKISNKEYSILNNLLKDDNYIIFHKVIKYMLENKIKLEQEAIA